MVNGYNYNDIAHRQWPLHLFEFEITDNVQPLESMQNDLNPHHADNTKLNEELLDRMADYGYFRSSILDRVYTIKRHESTTKHFESIQYPGSMTAFTFSECTLYFALQNDHKFVRTAKITEIFDGIDVDEMKCFSEIHDVADSEAASRSDSSESNPFLIGNNRDSVESEKMSFYEHNDSMIEVTATLNSITDSISTLISDMNIIGTSSLLVTRQSVHNSYYRTHSVSLLHIPMEFQYVHPLGVCKDESEAMDPLNDRWRIISSQYLYRNRLDSSRFYYEHQGLNEVAADFKSDRAASFMSSIHLGLGSSTSSAASRSKENSLMFIPPIFSSESQHGMTSVITSTPYFISLDHKGEFDDTVEIVNLKGHTNFVQSAINRKGDLLAILDNTDTILVLRKTVPFMHFELATDLVVDDDTEMYREDKSVYFEKVDGTKVQYRFSSFLKRRGLRDLEGQVQGLSALMDNETMLAQFGDYLRTEMRTMFINKELKMNNNEVAWQVAVEFTPTAMMQHLKPLHLLCIDADEMETLRNGGSGIFDDLQRGVHLNAAARFGTDINLGEVAMKMFHGKDKKENQKNDDDDDDEDKEDDVVIEGYVIVLFESGVISSYVIKEGEDGAFMTSSYLSGQAMDLWLETCIDWVELMFLMFVGAYFLCSCCRRSRVRIGVGRERVVGVDMNRPRRGGVGDIAANVANAAANAMAANVPVNVNVAAMQGNNGNGGNRLNDQMLRDMLPDGGGGNVGGNGGNQNDIQPINQNEDNRPPLILNDMGMGGNGDNDDDNEDDDDDDDSKEDMTDSESSSDEYSGVVNGQRAENGNDGGSGDGNTAAVNAQIAAAQAAMNRYRNITSSPILNRENREEKEEREEKTVSVGGREEIQPQNGYHRLRTEMYPPLHAAVRPDSLNLFPHQHTPSQAQMSSARRRQLQRLRGTDNFENSSPVSPLSPAVSGSDSDLDQYHDDH